MKKDNEFNCLLATILFLIAWNRPLEIILAKKTTELVILFHKKTTMLVLLWSKMGQRSIKVLNNCYYLIADAEWYDWVQCPSQFVICGIKVKIDADLSDSSIINEIVAHCCPI